MHTNSNVPVSYPIKKVIQEAEGVKTFLFDVNLSAEPGQFLMLWLPGVNEKPFAVSHEGQSIGVTVQKRGPFTEELHKKKEGDLVGLRGPYGKGFSLQGKKVLVVAGGYGAAPLFFLAERLRKKGIAVDFLLGARSKDRLIFVEKLKGLGVNMRISTDDGSSGLKGAAIGLLKQVDPKEFDFVFTCGPELMMRQVMEWALENNLKGEMALERYFKCGIGVCGQCEIGGYLVCKDGPVFPFDKVRTFKDFGESALDASGKRIPLKDFFRAKK